MHFTCRSFIGKSPPGNWSQYWENEPDDPLIVSQRGHLFGLINLTTDSDSQEASQIGHQIIDLINQSYFSSTDSPPSLQLTSSLDSIITDFTTKTSNLIIILAVIFQQEVHLATYHSGHCILKRANQISTILTGQDKKVVTISGPIQPQDHLFLTTDSFFQKITWSKIKSALAAQSTQEIEEDLLSSLYSFQDQSNLSAALIQVHTDIQTEPQTESPTNFQSDPISPSEPNSNIPNPSLTTTPPFPVKKTPFLKKLFAKKDVYVSHHQVKQIHHRKKINIIIALILLSALSISAFLGFRKNQAAKAEDNYQQLIQEISEKITNAHAVKNLSLDNALELAQEAASLLDQAKQLQLHPDQVTAFQEEINGLLSQTGSSRGLDIKSFYDTSLITNNPQYSKMIFSSPHLYLIDSSFGRIDTLNVEQRSTKNISISDNIKSAINLVESNNIPYLLTPDGISQLEKTDTNQKITFSGQKFSLTPLDIQSWNSALYVLTKNSIIKFTPSGTGFSAGSSWLQEDQSLPQNFTSFAINGKIWVLSSTGQLTPFVRGQKDSFKTPQETEITNANNLATTINTDLLAFTQGPNIIYVYKKNGETKSKYNLGDLTINDISIDENTNTLYILCTDQKIYQIKL